MNKATAKRAATRLLAALGSPQREEASAAFVEGGAASGRALLDALASGAAYGAPDANGRSVLEDLEAELIALGRAHPEVMIDAATRLPALAKGIAFVSALSRIPSEAAAAQLAVLLRARTGAIRGLALDALLERGDPRAISRLAAATRDRDGLVVFSAVTALRRWGVPHDLPRLLEIVSAPHTAPGTREAARDAIEGISLRAGLPLPEGTSRRLVFVPLPEGARVQVVMTLQVTKGTRLAADVIAPCDGLVIAIEADQIVIRRS